jgi:hypothetical protein
LTIRFSSVLIAAGQVVLHDDDLWSIAAAVVKGRHGAVFACGAADKERDLKAPTTKGALQETCANGLTDGYLVVLDLGEASASKGR